MGYNLYIKRTKGENILLKDWIDYVRSDSEFEMGNDEHVGTNPVTGKVIRVKSDNIVYWSYGEYKVPFTFNGEYGIAVKNPDENIIVKMLKVSKILDAIVEGDEGEIIDESFIDFFENYIEEDSNVSELKIASNVESNFQSKKPWWKFW